MFHNEQEGATSINRFKYTVVEFTAKIKLYEFTFKADQSISWRHATKSFSKMWTDVARLNSWHTHH